MSLDDFEKGRIVIQSTAVAGMKAAGIKRPSAVADNRGNRDTGVLLKLTGNGKSAVAQITRSEVEDCDDRVDSVSVDRKINDAIDRLK
jgi:hypothetical protein